MTAQLSRRSFLATAGAAASLTLLAQTTFQAESASAASLFVRRNVGGMNAYDPVITAYRKAVATMKALSPSDPRSWTYQAAIHGTFAGPPQTAWNTCQHGNYFFWSWHRMYLYWFERICRRMACDDCFALPYWNYNDLAQRQLPSMFRDTTSDLYVSARNGAMNSGAGSLPGWAVDYSAGFAQPNFNSASSSFEGLPHNQVHVLVGGWMGSVPTAAQDPIFFLHHCNMDRLWNLWLAQGGGRIDPVFDNTWKNTKYTFFDEEGAQVEMSGCDILRAAQQLHYVYEGEPAQVNDYCLPIRKFPPIIFEKEPVLRLPIPEIRLEQEPITVPVDWKEAKQRVSSLAERKDEIVFLEIDGVEADRQPGVSWQVYFGPAMSGEPSEDSPYLVGAIALFGQGIHGESHDKEKFEPAKFAFPINRALAAGVKSNAERWTIVFVPRGILIDGKPSRPKVESPVRVKSISITVETHKPGEEK
jgi:tyrosinase